MTRYFFALLFSCIYCAAACSTAAHAQNATEVPLYGNTVVRFATQAEAKELLSRRDTYIAAMSRFDRQCRMTTALDPTDDELMRFISAQALAWDQRYVDWFAQRIEAVRQRLAPLRLQLPRKVVFIYTTGKEEGNAAYCRYPAVILPQQITRRPADDVERLILHELFHILSVHDPAFRKAMYGLIGFTPCDDIELPASLAQRKLTNPDAPSINCWIDVDVNGKRALGAPLLYASAEQYDPKQGGNLFSYLTFRLILLERREGTLRPIVQDSQAVLVDPKKLPSYYEQIGRNTDYVIHPDEILADNFSFLVLGRPNLATPQLTQRMHQILLGRGN